ncbi:MAG: hypothetical protein II923_05010 [Campylobacter sp.]|nr:hypothetical protein [Campylobacter sp.]MBQ7270141.1 hypothetical protein [Campylobacter sp.]
MINEKVKSFLLSDVGFDGGDLGSPDNQSIWLCGIEWGGGYCDISDLIEDTKNNGYISLEKIIEDSESYKDKGYKNKCINLAYQFNVKAVKLLASLCGYKDDYLEFNDKIKPFVKGEKGFFKLNLFPVTFKSLDDKLREKFLKELGFENEAGYKKFCRDERFPLIKNLKEKYEPKIIICVGVSIKSDFENAFGISKTTESECKNFWYAPFEYKSGNKGLFVVTRFLSFHKNNLNSDDKIGKCGKDIAKIAEKNGIKPCK